MAHLLRLLSSCRRLNNISILRMCFNETCPSYSLTSNKLSHAQFCLVFNGQPWVRVHPFSVPDFQKDLSVQKRNFAKGKDKGKGGGKSSVRSHISEEELAQIVDVDSFKNDLNRALEHLKEEFLTNLSLRTSTGSLENLSVEFDGEKYPLSEIAQIIKKSPTMIIINSTIFPQATPGIKKAIEESGMNLNPQQDGSTFYIQIHKVTKEHRESLAQNAKILCDKTKTQLKEIQNKCIKKMKSLNGKVSEDLIFNAQVKIREITQASVSQAEMLMKNKQNELLKISK